MFWGLGMFRGREIWGVKVQYDLCNDAEVSYLLIWVFMLSFYVMSAQPTIYIYIHLQGFEGSGQVKTLTIIIHFIKHFYNVKTSQQIDSHAPKSASQGWGATLQFSALPGSHSGVLWCLDLHIAILMQCSCSKLSHWLVVLTFRYSLDSLDCDVWCLHPFQMNDMLQTAELCSRDGYIESCLPGSTSPVIVGLLQHTCADVWASLAPCEQDMK